MHVTHCLQDTTAWPHSTRVPAVPCYDHRADESAGSTLGEGPKARQIPNAVSKGGVLLLNHWKVEALLRK